MTYVYLCSERSLDHELWTVGFYKPDGEWVSESDHRSKQLAAERVHWLNGGETQDSQRQLNRLNRESQLRVEAQLRRT